MSRTASILAALICVLVSRAAAIKCLSCTESARPRDCQYIQECGPHEKCSIEAYMTVMGYIRYDVGCMDGSKCAVAGRKRAVLNATVITEIQQKNDFGTIPDEQWDHGDKSVCIECCDTELCNIRGCGEEGLPPNSGLICYGCDQERNPDSCNRITLCDRDYACHLSTMRIGVDLVYKSGCIHTQDCHRQGVLNIGAYEIVGRRGMDMTSRFKRAVFCTKCCSTNLCNADNCTLLTHPPTTLPPTTTLAPVNGGWNSWSHWNLCSVTCGGGQHYRIRFCDNPAPADSGAICSGSNRETQLCNDQLCAVDANWSDWSPWSACTATCGSTITKNRKRTCTNPAPSPGAANCVGTAFEEVSCNLGACSVDGNWSDWGAWFACTATCGSSVTRSRTRTCTNPAQSSEGANCTGTALEVVSCNLGACPLDGNWSDWGLWSACTATCGSSVTRSRTRTCTNPAPSPGGTTCIGSALEAVACNLGACAIDGQWSLWMTWSACSKTCGTGGIISRQRNCNNPTPSGNGIYCIGEANQIHQCSGRNDQEFIHSVQNFTQPIDAQVVIKCVAGVTLPAEVTKVTWSAPQIIGHTFPSNLAQLRDGSLFIDGLTVENIGAYSCTITTDCGTYDSPNFWVNIQ